MSMNFNAPRDDIDPDTVYWVGACKCRKCGHVATCGAAVPIDDQWPPPLECGRCGEVEMVPVAERDDAQ